MGFDFVVLGATGMQGKIVSKDLLERGYSVLLCGRDKERVEHILNHFSKSKFEYIEMRDVKRVAETLKKSKSEIVINCVEGDWNLNALKACIAAKCHCLDLGSEIWMTKEQLKIHSDLKKKGLISITGCGSVPGIGNVMLNYASKKFDKLNTIEVGFAWDSNIKKFVVPFSIKSIIEEFTAPAPVILHGKTKKFIPLETVKESKHTYVEPQKEFFVRHPETYTFYYYFKNKGLKNVKFYAGFPEHSFDYIKALIELGFGSKEEKEYMGNKIIPVDFLTEILKGIIIPEGYTEKENLWINIEGTKNGKKKNIMMECLVPTLKGWEDAGCNIDTGMPASIMAQMIKENIIKERGSFAPEAIIPPEHFFKELAKRNMNIFENGKQIN